MAICESNIILHITPMDNTEFPMALECIRHEVNVTCWAMTKRFNGKLIIIALDDKNNGYVIDGEANHGFGEVYSEGKFSNGTRIEKRFDRLSKTAAILTA